MRRGVLALLLVGLVATPLVAAAGPAAAQSGGATQNATSKYSLAELRDGGTHQAGAPPSMRFMGQYGSATLRHDPVGLGSKPWGYVKPGRTLVKRNQVTLKTIRLGDPDPTLTVHVVAWDRGTRTVSLGNSTTRQEPVARNVTERTVTVKLERGYDTANVSLPASFGQKQHITLWIEEYPSARWVFEHRSIATTKPISIDSWGDFLETLFWRIGVFALPSMLVSWWLAKRHRERAIVGPQWGPLKWLAAFGVPIVLLSSVYAFQGAVLAVRVPPLIGVLFGPLTYALVLEAGDDKLEQFLFRWQDLEHAKTPRGDDAHDSRYVDHIVKQGVRREAAGELVLIEPGMMSYIARLRGELAVLDITEVETHKEGKGRYALEIELDPDSHPQDALHHDPPRLVRRPMTITADVPGLGESNLPNPAVVVPLGGGATAGWFAADATLGIPGVGVVAGVVLGLPFIYHIESGGAEAECAPYHFTQAEASLAKETAEYSDAKTLEQFREIAWSERMKTPLEAREIIQQFDETVSRQLNESELGDLSMDDILDDEESDRIETGGVAGGDD